MIHLALRLTIYGTRASSMLELWRGFLWVTKDRATAMILLCSFLFTLQLSAQEDVRPDGLPSDYDLIGVYLTKSKIRVHNGTAIQQLAPNTTYKVYGNGQNIRVYNNEVPDAFHQYEIYRSDGISTLNEDGTTRVLPGMQARNTQSAILKQLSVSPASLTITLIPPLSDTVTIIYANRAEKK